MTRRVGTELASSSCSLVDLDVPRGGPRRARIRSFRTIPWSLENAEAFVATLRLLGKSRIVPARAAVALWDRDIEPKAVIVRRRSGRLLRVQIEEGLGMRA